MDVVARMGLVAKGVLYAVLGTLALRVALGDGSGQSADTRGAISTLARQPFGAAMVGALAVGCGAYACWRAWQAFRGEGDSELPLWMHRVSLGFRALVYAGFAFLAASEFAGSMSSSGGGTEESMTKRLLEMPGGRWIVIGVAAGIVGVAVAQLVRAVRRTFMDDLEWTTRTRRRVVLVSGVAGHAGRGAAFALVGGFLAHAAWTFQADEGVGLDGALQETAGATWGTTLIVAVAVGFLSYALFLVLMAWLTSRANDVR